MLVLMAIFSTVITTPLLRRWMRRAGFGAASAASFEAPGRTA